MQAHFHISLFVYVFKYSSLLFTISLFILFYSTISYPYYEIKPNPQVVSKVSSIYTCLYVYMFPQTSYVQIPFFKSDYDEINTKIFAFYAFSRSDSLIVHPLYKRIGVLPTSLGPTDSFPFSLSFQFNLTRTSGTSVSRE